MHDTAAEVLWRPSGARIAAAQLTRFSAGITARHGLALPDYAALHAWSVRDPATFWTELARYAGVRGDLGGLAIEHPGRLPGATFFPGGRLNFAENLLACDDDHAALVCYDETGARRALSYHELRVEVARVADGLKQAGVAAGDRVAALLPNVPETVIALLASSSLGAIFTSCSPDFGAAGVLDRFGQVAPRVLFATDGYVYGGKTFDTLPALARIVAGLPSLERVVVVPTLRAQPALAGIRHGLAWADFGRAGRPLEFSALPFNAPLCILYSSGTTGPPKCILHGAGGTLLQHRKEHLLHTDLGPDDRFFYFTTCGWMMWNWLVSGLAGGATLILYDGSPLHPDPGVLWRMAEAEAVTIFGTSAKYLAALEKSGYRPAAGARLTALRTLLSTGSPLLPEQFDFVYRDIKADLHLASISGGTDIASCFVLGCPTLPVRRGEIQVAGLGMDVRVFNEAGASVRGERGELVCAAPFPCVPLGFWNDADGARFHAAYFERFPGVWHHGDFAEVTPSGGFVIHGRSDAVLNPGGVRIGTAEICRPVEQLDDVLESLAVGQEWQGDTRVILFLRLRPGVSLTGELEATIRRLIRASTTPRHVPARIIAVADLPRTRNGKLVELAVRDVIHGRPVRNLEAIANPEVLDLFRDLPQLGSA